LSFLGSEHSSGVFLTDNMSWNIMKKLSIVEGIMAKINLVVVFLLAASLASAEQIAFKMKDGDVVHWDAYWQDKDTGNYCTNMWDGAFCIDKSEIARVYKGQDTAKINKKMRQWTNTASGRSLDIIAGGSGTTMPASTKAGQQTKASGSANARGLNNRQTNAPATSAGKQQASPSRRSSCGN
jgi:hypothetical protein